MFRLAIIFWGLVTLLCCSSTKRESTKVSEALAIQELKNRCPDYFEKYIRVRKELEGYLKEKPDTLAKVFFKGLGIDHPDHLRTTNSCIIGMKRNNFIWLFGEPIWSKLTSNSHIRHDLYYRYVTPFWPHNSVVAPSCRLEVWFQYPTDTIIQILHIHDVPW